MEKYFYTKEGIDSEVLCEAIRLRTSLRADFIGAISSDRKNEDGTVVDDNVELHFSRVLLSAEQDEIASLVNILDASYDLMIRKSIEENTMAWAMKSGAEILGQFSANNVYRGKTQPQTEALINDYPNLILSLLTGSLITAYGVFASMQASDNISQEEIDEFTLRLQIVLGI